MGSDRPLAGQPGIPCILASVDPLTALRFVLLLRLTARTVYV